MKNSIQSFFTKNFGVGQALALKMCYHIGVAPQKPAILVADFKKEQALRYLSKKKILTGFQLRNKELSAFTYYNTIGNIKSFKFRALLPIRGQRNKTNGKTAKKRAIEINKKLTSQKKKKKKERTPRTLP